MIIINQTNRALSVDFATVDGALRGGMLMPFGHRNEAGELDDRCECTDADLKQPTFAGLLERGDLVKEIPAPVKNVAAAPAAAVPSAKPNKA